MSNVGNSRQGVVQRLREDQNDAGDCGSHVVPGRNQKLRGDGILPEEGVSVSRRRRRDGGCDLLTGEKRPIRHHDILCDFQQ